MHTVLSMHLKNAIIMNTTLRRSLFWIDTGTQAFLLLTCLVSAAVQQGLVALIGLFFLGIWQLGSALLVGVITGDRVRLLYFACASSLVVLFIAVFKYLFPMVFPDSEWVFALLMVFSYLAGGFYFGLHWQRSYRPVQV